MNTNIVFSYTDSNDGLLRSSFIKTIELLTGRFGLHKSYNNALHFMETQNMNFWEAAVIALDLKLDFAHEQIEKIPKEGPLVIVANHPFGVIDGIVIGHLVNLVRSDFKIMTNSMLCQAKDLASYLLPVDFANTKAAKQQNLLTRQQAKQQVEEGKCLVLFPAGGVSTTQGFKLKATDFPWQVFTSELIHAGKADVVPLFFHGQNSLLFQWVSQISMVLRYSLLIHEAQNKKGKELKINIGETIPYEQLANIKKRKVLVTQLRDKTYSLADVETQ